jgi:hypothetical protein
MLSSYNKTEWSVFFCIHFYRKSSCGDLQSRLKVRKVLGVGDTSGSTCSSKIGQILGQSENFIFKLPPILATWLLLVTALFSCFTVMVRRQKNWQFSRLKEYFSYLGSSLAILFASYFTWQV